MHRLGLRYVVFNYELVFRGVYFSNSLLDIDCICLIMILTRERERERDLLFSCYASVQAVSSLYVLLSNTCFYK